ncbi:conjugal transfer pilus assembly protein TraL (plasmid) [Piscirickettsia salmonis]|uniref:Conjugal transfer protein TraL n=2 Tax=Piscirickettsia salmonis TaxID=1238 RepID=A0AAC8VL68_PISSA|nr:type IV conjugative transfer system protein TraL [Piscirickettsia salmonis]ALB24371.1 conjugal transfer protein TraL [Piscirickettsia salmonis]ALY04342.1 conjugal transfer protein TraL [Piscirickettsia salmonis]KLV36859.1 conjugal transfer protein TraL [Piscirickettsia salmonis]QGO00507.1 conjugal transfer pilus assembly protein TraL [Piscirickettsia salmonis]QGO14687.1 conjugal transfer pilus assembly protein TraL [Piscirickettsia salmonis]
MSRSYETFILSDEPKLFGIPIVSGLPCIALTIVGLLAGYTFQLFFIGAIASLLLHVKFGADGIRFFLSVIYWFLPSKFTRIFFWHSPNSAYRLYLK